jgi:arginine/lysine/ornithine decarboxylase
MKLDQRRAPLAEAVHSFRQENVVPFTTPGHKRGRGIPGETAEWLGAEPFLNDIPLASGVDDTHMGRGVLAEAEKLAADAFGAEHSFFLLNGSSLGNQSALMAVAGPGDEVIVARNFHKSMLAALILTGARPVYIRPRHNSPLDVSYGVDPRALADALHRHPSARAVLLVSPTYFGIASDLASLSGLAHQHGLPLIVDEAWAPHFAFHPALPPTAMVGGADIGIASIHKVLSGFTQSSIMNVQGTHVSVSRLATCLGLLQTTSPSAFVLASIDACRRQMALHGRELLDRTLQLADGARAAINRLPGLHVMGDEIVGAPDAAALDRTKLVIDLSESGISGYAADVWLRERHRVTVEMSDHRRIVALLSIADDESSVGHLVGAIRELSESRCERTETRRALPHDSVTLQTESVLTPREAFFADVESVPLHQARGRLAAEVITPYPPGIPLLAPGERITREIVEYLEEGIAAGMHVTGAVDRSLSTLKVVR